MSVRRWLACAIAFLPLGGFACGSSGGSSGPPPAPCASSQVPSTVHLTVSGFSKCTCFNGTFALVPETGFTTEPGIWSSAPITGCPGQGEPAYLKLSVQSGSFGIGICDQGSDPGSGNGDFSPTTGGTCSPFSLSGGRATAGNINSFCPGAEDLEMSWSATK